MQTLENDEEAEEDEEENGQNGVVDEDDDDEDDEEESDDSEGEEGSDFDEDEEENVGLRYLAGDIDVSSWPGLSSFEFTYPVFAGGKRGRERIYTWRGGGG